MEHLWSRAVATGGNWPQTERYQERLKPAETVAMGCDRLRIGAHGKRGSTTHLLRPLQSSRSKATRSSAHPLCSPNGQPRIPR
jgi:hypothetical protein